MASCSFLQIFLATWLAWGLLLNSTSLQAEEPALNGIQMPCVTAIGKRTSLCQSNASQMCRPEPSPQELPASSMVSQCRKDALNGCRQSKRCYRASCKANRKQRMCPDYRAQHGTVRDRLMPCSGCTKQPQQWEQPKHGKLMHPRNVVAIGAIDDLDHGLHAGKTMLAPMLHVGLMETARALRIVDPSLLLLG
jgi:hypothetical protein